MRCLSCSILLTLLLVPKASWCKAFEQPWGKDAELCSPIPFVPPASNDPLRKFGDACIRFHQEVISPADGPRSSFVPSSSQYTRDAMAKYGFFWGFAFGCDRLLRENGEVWIYPTTTGAYGCAVKVNPVP